MDQKQKIHDFFATQQHMVIATTTNDIPEAALVGFHAKDDLTIIFGTATTSRKFQNIQNNSRVAIVVHSEKTVVQLEGVVSVLLGHEIAEDKKKLFEKIPGAAKFDQDPNQVYLRVMPVWARFVDYSEDVPVAFEIRL